MLFPAAGGDDQHGALARQRAFSEAVAPTLIAMLADAIGETIGVHPIDPALEDRRHGVPPERKLQDQGVGPQQILDLSRDIFGQRVGLEGLFGGEDRYESRIRRLRRKIGTIDLGLPAVRIEVRHPDLVALGLEFLDGDVPQRAVERARFGMGEDEEDIHRSAILG